MIRVERVSILVSRASQDVEIHMVITCLSGISTFPNTINDNGICALKEKEKSISACDELPKPRLMHWTFRKSELTHSFIFKSPVRLLNSCRCTQMITSMLGTDYLFSNPRLPTNPYANP